MKKRTNDPMPLSLAIPLLIFGLLLGNVFTFGMQYWNQSVEKDACTTIETQFLAYDEICGKHRQVKEIAVDCLNGERYFIDGVSINEKLENALIELQAYDEITLLIHPHSNTVVEMRTEDTVLLEFEDTIEKLGNERTGFLFLGIFSYVLALIGLYYIILYKAEKNRTRK